MREKFFQRKDKCLIVSNRSPLILQGFIVLLSFLISIFLPQRVLASDDPILINTPTSDFVLESVASSSPLDISFTVGKDDVSEVLLRKNSKVSTSGSIQEFEIDGKSIIALEMRLSKVSGIEDSEEFLSRVIFKLKSPSGKDHVIAGKDLLIIDLPEEGGYELELVADELPAYSLSVYKLKSPFYGKVSYVGPEVDFNLYKDEFEDYIDSGGNAIIYNNEEAEEYFTIEKKRREVSEVVTSIDTDIESIFDKYFKEGDEIFDLTSERDAESILSYRGINLALLFRGEEGAGSVMILNPSLLTLEDFELEVILSEISGDAFGSVAFFGRGELVKSVLKLGGVIGVVILLYLAMRKEIKGLIQEENYIQGLATRLNKCRKKIKFPLVFVNLLCLFGAFIFFYLLWRYREGVLADGLFHVFFEYEFFLLNFGIESLAFPLQAFVLGIFLFDILILIWIKWDLVMKIRDGIVRRVFGSIGECMERKLLKGVAYFLTLALLVFSYLTALSSRKILEQFLVILIIVLAVVLFAGEHSSKIQFTSFEKKLLRPVKILFISAPILLLLYIAYSFTTPFGLDQTYEFDTEELGRVSDIDPNFGINYEESWIDVHYTPHFEGKCVKTTISQELETDSTIYLAVENEEEHLGDYLFYDKNLVEFENRIRVGETYIYSRDEIKERNSLGETLDSGFEEGDAVGLDKTLYVVEEDEPVVSLTDYYADVVCEQGSLDIEVNLKGSFEFYTVLSNKLALEITYTDDNLFIGRDDFSIRLENQDGQIVASKFVEDDNGAVQIETSINKVTFETKGLPEGVYKIVFSSGDIGTWSNIPMLSDDITIQNVKINSSKLVLSSVEGGRMRFQKATKLFFLPLESSLTTSGIVEPYAFREQSCDVLGISGGGQGEDYSSIDETTLEYKVSSQNLQSLELVCPYQDLISSYNFYSFTRDSYFYPYMYYFTEIDSADEAVITRSDLKVNKDSGNWYNSELILEDMDYSFGFPVLFRFYKSPSLDNYYSPYLIHNFILKFEDK